MDVVLIRPRYNLASSLFNKHGTNGVKETYPQLGLCYLEAKLQQGGFSAEILDGLFLDQKNIFDRIKENSPKLIGIHVVSPTIPEVLCLIKGLRLVSKSPIVLGGPHITHCPESIQSFSADYGIRGDGEESLLQLVKFLSYEEGNIEDIPGIIFKRDGLLQVSERAEISDLDQLPPPNFKPAAESPYFSPLISERMTTMIISRGCPFDCVYCALPNKRCYKTRSVDNILTELAMNVNKGYTYIDFKDDNFTYDMSRTEDLCQRVIEERIEFNWGCTTRVDFLNEKLICLMRKAGCSNIKFGIESGVRRVQQVIGKVVPIDKIMSTIQLIKRYGIDTIAYFSLGHPGETLSDMRQTTNLIKKIQPDYIEVFLCNPIPGSRLFDIAVEEGKLSADFWSLVDKIDIMPIYVPDGLNLKDMRELQKQAYRKFYFNSGYILFQLRKVKHFKELWNKARLALLLWKEACR